MTIGDVNNYNPLLSSNGVCPNEVEEKEIAFVNTPKLVESLSKHHITKVACGLIHAIAIDSKANTCFSWGSNSHGQLGRPTKLHADQPQEVEYFR